MSIDEPGNWPDEDDSLDVVSTEAVQPPPPEAQADDRFPEDLYPSELPNATRKTRSLVLVGFVVAAALVAFVVARLVSNRVGETVALSGNAEQKIAVPLLMPMQASEWSATVDRCAVTKDQFIEISGTVTNKSKTHGVIQVIVSYVESIDDVSVDPQRASDSVDIASGGTEKWDVRLRGMSNDIDGALPSTVSDCKVVEVQRDLGSGRVVDPKQLGGGS